MLLFVVGMYSISFGTSINNSHNFKYDVSWIKNKKNYIDFMPNKVLISFKNVTIKDLNVSYVKIIKSDDISKNSSAYNIYTVEYLFFLKTKQLLISKNTVTVKNCDGYDNLMYRFDRKIDAISEKIMNVSDKYLVNNLCNFECPSIDSLIDDYIREKNKDIKDHVLDSVAHPLRINFNKIYIDNYKENIIDMKKRNSYSYRTLGEYYRVGSFNGYSKEFHIPLDIKNIIKSGISLKYYSKDDNIVYKIKKIKKSLIIYKYYNITKEKELLHQKKKIYNETKNIID